MSPDLVPIRSDVGLFVTLALSSVSVIVACDGAPPVNGDPAMLRQAFLNLGLNACQAMPNGGTLRIDPGVQLTNPLGPIFDPGLAVTFVAMPRSDGGPHVQRSVGMPEPSTSRAVTFWLESIVMPGSFSGGTSACSAARMSAE